jgi:hypothetical protein
MLVFEQCTQSQETLRLVFTLALLLMFHRFPLTERSIPMTPEEREELIGKYAAGYDEVMRSLEGFPAEALTARPLPGKWSACEIVHHLADSEMASALRLRQLL